MPAPPPLLDPKLEDELAENDPESLRLVQAERRKLLDLEWPKPTPGDLDEVKQRMETAWAAYREEANEQHDLRYLKDETPEKYRKFLSLDRRLRTRLSHNEINRVVALLTRNTYTVYKPPADISDKAGRKAEKQERWGQEFLQACERRAGKPLRRILLDAAVHLGHAAWEVYLTDSYDKLDIELGEDETDKEFNARVEGMLIGADLPVALRVIHPLALFYEMDDDGAGIGRVMIIEEKPYRKVFSHLYKTKSAEAFNELRLPKPGTAGVTAYFNTASTNPTVQTIRYYDARWYAYMVGGKVITCEEHGLPGNPIFPVQGISTSSPDIAQAIQGVTWGMGDIERALNDLMTLGVDVAYVGARPRLVVETVVDGRVIPDPNNPKMPMTLDLTDPNKSVQLNPGQRVVNAFENYKPQVPGEILELLQNLWQRSGLNPIAQGSSPGADPAGYTVNTLIETANDLYGILLDNDARTFGEVLDFVTSTIKYTVGEKVYLPVMGRKKGKERIEWLGLGPEDVDDTPYRVVSDPTSESNRLSRVRQLKEGWQDGVVPRDVLQEQGYGAEDTDEWNHRILIQQAQGKLAPYLVDVVIQEVMAEIQQASQGGAPPGGQPPSDGIAGMSPMGGATPPPPGSEPAPTNPPAIGPAGAQASRGVGAMAPGAQAGQDNGYRPPPGISARG